jgi:hypothetical protein
MAEAANTFAASADHRKASIANTAESSMRQSFHSTE